MNTPMHINRTIFILTDITWKANWISTPHRTAEPYSISLINLFLSYFVVLQFRSKISNKLHHQDTDDMHSSVLLFLFTVVCIRQLNLAIAIQLPAFVLVYLIEIFYKK